MRIDDIPRTMVRTSLQAARLPLTTLERVMNRDKRAQWPAAMFFDGYAAGVKQLVGGMLRDQELVEEGRLEQAKLAQLRRAGSLEATADERRARADAEFQQRQERDEQLREEVANRAAKRAADIEQAAADKQRRADRTKRQKAAAAKKAERLTTQARASSTRQAKRTAISAERGALSTTKRALAADAKVAKLDGRIKANKAARKAN